MKNEYRWAAAFDVLWMIACILAVLISADTTGDYSVSVGLLAFAAIFSAAVMQIQMMKVEDVEKTAWSYVLYAWPTLLWISYSQHVSFLSSWINFFIALIIGAVICIALFVAYSIIDLKGWNED
jgi:hypothetical protein